MDGRGRGELELVEIGLNVCTECADDHGMTDVDAIRYLASEHDLEFVDLESYAIDAGASEILPEALARRHHVVPVKRKFGTPVIAIANPDDIFALDMLRASVGREFISVVASRQQIGDLLDRFYGPAGPGSGMDDHFDPGEGALGGADDQLGLSLFGSAFLPSKSAGDDPNESESSTSGLTANGHRNVGGAGTPPELAEDALWQDLMADPMTQSTVVVQPKGWQQAAQQSGEREWVESDPASTLGLESAQLETETRVQEAIELQAQPEAWTEPESSPEAWTEPESSPEAWTEPESSPEAWTEPESSPEVPAVWADGDGGVVAEAEGVVATADLVEEVVASYEESHTGPDQGMGSTSDMPPLAKALIEGGRVSLADMEAVVDEQHRHGQSIARILTTRNLVSEADLMWGMAKEMGLEFVDLDTMGVNYTATSVIPEATARHHNVLVVGEEGGVPVVAASNPTDVFAMDDLRTIIGSRFTTVVATRSQISAYITRAYHAGGDAADMAKTASLEFDRQDTTIDDIQAVTEEAPIVRYVNLLVVQALNERASDIHVEPTANELRIRYRIDGVLHDVSTAPRSIAAAVTTRLKVMADMNIAEHRVPQDGRISLNVGTKGVDLRMATLPTIHGEKIVMRVLDKSSVVLGFPELGFDQDLLATYEGIFTKPYGTILVTGPTGSGKSTTLYTTLTALNSPEKNIITVEDPVELQLQGINQVQLNLKAGLTFASALKAILRSDPDIVLVGEIRDKETAVIAIEAALTGHLVLATLHTNSASSTPMRLVEMGIEPFLVTSSLSAVLAQRLARRLCVHCKEPYQASEAEILGGGWRPEEVDSFGAGTTLFRAVGCSACSNTGYRGRKALAELMPMTEEIERMIIEGGSVDEIHRLAVSQGMVTLRQSGLRKAIEGETTLEEVLRVVA